eukprot:TRINITY_DN7472_c0_g3_i4.p1 TRINITY_DN7472_c0_g3~~TRINITY_DN7472_c0_g3_i4.p1  ORF type:complete len:1557 (+),score=478.40 TRINITY_DN7472_c0_g3_i4:77-4672(+)
MPGCCPGGPCGRCCPAQGGPSWDGEAAGRLAAAALPALCSDWAFSARAPPLGWWHWGDGEGEVLAIFAEREVTVPAAGLRWRAGSELVLGPADAADPALAGLAGWQCTAVGGQQVRTRAEFDAAAAGKEELPLVLRTDSADVDSEPPAASADGGEPPARTGLPADARIVAATAAPDGGLRTAPLERQQQRQGPAPGGGRCSCCGPCCGALRRLLCCPKCFPCACCQEKREPPPFHPEWRVQFPDGSAAEIAEDGCTLRVLIAPCAAAAPPGGGPKQGKKPEDGEDKAEEGDGKAGGQGEKRAKKPAAGAAKAAPEWAWRCPSWIADDPAQPAAERGARRRARGRWVARCALSLARAMLRQCPTADRDAALAAVRPSARRLAGDAAGLSAGELAEVPSGADACACAAEWIRADSAGEGALPAGRLRELGVAAGSGRWRALLSSTDGAGLTFGEFRAMWLRASADAEALSHFRAACGGGGGGLAASELQQLLAAAGSADPAEEAAGAVRALGAGSALTQQGYAEWRRCPQTNPAADRRLTGEVTQDMALPLHYYYIAAASCPCHGPDEQGQGHRGTARRCAAVLRQGCRFLELDCSDGPHGPVVGSGTSRTLFSDCLRAICSAAFAASPYPVVLGLTVRASAEQQREMAQLLREHLGRELWVPPGGSCHAAAFSPASLQGSILLMARARDGGAWCGRPTQQPQLADSEDDTAPTAGEQGEGQRRGARLPPLAAELAALVALPGARYDTVQQAAQEGKPYEVESFCVFRLASELHNSHTDVSEANKMRILRVYRSGSRVASGGAATADAFGAGAQIVPADYRARAGSELARYRGFFSANGGSGYVLKPERLRIPGLPAAPGAEEGGRLRLRVLRAWHLPGGAAAAVYVIASVVGPGQPAAAGRLQTKVVEDDAFSPSWAQDSRAEHSFPVADRALACLSVQVWGRGAAEAEELLCEGVVPLCCLRDGTRALPLRTAGGSEALPASSVVCSVQWAPTCGRDTAAACAAALCCVASEAARALPPAPAPPRVRAAMAPAPVAPAEEEVLVRKKAGEALGLNIANEAGRLWVSNVAPGSPADEAGVGRYSGCALTAIDGQPPRTLDDLRGCLPREAVVLRLQRPEMRRDPADGKLYSRRDFRAFHGEERGEELWAAAAPAVGQQRAAKALPPDEDEFAEGSVAQVQVLDGELQGEWLDCRVVKRTADGRYGVKVLAQSGDAARFSGRRADGIPAKHLRRPPPRSARTAPAALEEEEEPDEQFPIVPDAIPRVAWLRRALENFYQRHQPAESAGARECALRFAGDEPTLAWRLAALLPQVPPSELDFLRHPLRETAPLTGPEQRACRAEGERLRQARRERQRTRELFESFWGYYDPQMLPSIEQALNRAGDSYAVALQGLRQQYGADPPPDWRNRRLMEAERRLADLADRLSQATGTSPARAAPGRDPAGGSPRQAPPAGWATAATPPGGQRAHPPWPQAATAPVAAAPCSLLPPPGQQVAHPGMQLPQVQLPRARVPPQWQAVSPVPWQPHPHRQAPP